jgi:hypothetical protein
MLEKAAKYADQIRPMGRQPANPYMEIRLVEWINKVLTRGYKLTQTEIRNKARCLMKKYNGDSKFAASKGWMEKFFRRHKQIAKQIMEKNRTRIEEMDSSDSDEYP